MKKIPKSAPLNTWYDNNLLIGAVSTLCILIVLEILFAIPSRWIHDPIEPKIDIVREERPKTNLKVDESPAFCTMEYMPVCGDDGKTYGNKCMAGVAKVNIVSSGECQNNEKTINNNESSENKNSTEVLPIVTQAEDYTNTGKYHIYTNNSIGYSMAFPKYSWYYGFGARDGASHSMAIALDEAGIASFESAPVRVWFYRTKPATPPSDQSLTLEKGVIYVSSSSDNPKIQKIVADIFASAK